MSLYSYGSPRASNTKIKATQPGKSYRVAATEDLIPRQPASHLVRVLAYIDRLSTGCIRILITWDLTM